MLSNKLLFGALLVGFILASGCVAQQAPAAQGRAVITISDPSVDISSLSKVEMTVDKIELHSSPDAWTTVSTEVRTYDLLALKAGDFALVWTDGKVSAGSYDKVKLHFAKVVVTKKDGTIKEAEIIPPDGSLTINGNIEIAKDQTTVVKLDFDVSKSLFETSEGKILFGPYLTLQATVGATVTISPEGKVTESGGKTTATVTVVSDFGVKKSPGQACALNSDCAAGFCVDGVCCDKACTGTCQACSSSKTGGTSGVCSNISAGTDPDNECTGELACNGAGACTSTATPTPTLTPTPSGCGANQVLSGSTCVCSTGFADCNAVKADGCEVNTLTSPTACGGCGIVCASRICTSGVCVPVKRAGEVCIADSQCVTGYCLISQSGDRVCSTVPSCGSCKVIDSTGSVCVDAIAGTDPKSDCAADSVQSCGNNGFCNGSGSCQKYSSSTVCAQSACTNLGYVPPSQCSGAGSCQAPSPQSCEDQNPCTTDSCAPATGCTHAPVTDGTSCGPNNVCQNGVCV